MAERKAVVAVAVAVALWVAVPVVAVVTDTLRTPYICTAGSYW